MTDHTTDREASVRARLDTGELYVDAGEGLAALEAERVAGKELCFDYNRTRPGEQAERTRLLGELLGSAGRGVWIEPPFHVAYGTHVEVGDDFYANFNLVIVDDAHVSIGDRVLIAPNVTLTTAGHPVDPAVRRGGQQFSVPIRLEDDVWLGANVVVLPGVTVGAGSVVAAGSVVTRDVPPGVVAGGVPCRVLREIGPDDAEFVYRGPRPNLR